MAPSKVKLFNDSPSEMFFVAISCNLEDYRFVHFLNKGLQTNFRKLSDLLYYENENTQNQFSLYHDTINGMHANQFIIKNKSDNQAYLIPKLKTTDYILIIDSPLTEEYKDNLLQSLEDVPVVFIATEIDVQKIKTIERIIEDLELSLMDNLDT